MGAERNECESAIICEQSVPTLEIGITSSGAKHCTKHYGVNVTCAARGQLVLVETKNG